MSSTLAPLGVGLVKRKGGIGPSGLLKAVESEQGGALSWYVCRTVVEAGEVGDDYDETNKSRQCWRRSCGVLKRSEDSVWRLAGLRLGM